MNALHEINGLSTAACASIRCYSALEPSIVYRIYHEWRAIPRKIIVFPFINFYISSWTNAITDNWAHDSRYPLIALKMNISFLRSLRCARVCVCVCLCAHYGHMRAYAFADNNIQNIKHSTIDQMTTYAQSSIRDRVVCFIYYYYSLLQILSLPCVALIHNSRACVYVCNSVAHGHRECGVYLMCVCAYRLQTIKNSDGSWIHRQTSDSNCEMRCVRDVGGSVFAIVQIEI